MLDMISGLSKLNLKNEIRRDSGMSDEVLFEVYQEKQVQVE